MEINKTYLLRILSGAPGEFPSAESTDQGASIPFRRQVNCWKRILLRDLLLGLTKSGNSILVDLLSYCV